MHVVEVTQEPLVALHISFPGAGQAEVVPVYCSKSASLFLLVANASPKFLNSEIAEFQLFAVINDQNLGTRLGIPY